MGFFYTGNATRVKFVSKDLFEHATPYGNSVARCNSSLGVW